MNPTPLMIRLENLAFGERIDLTIQVLKHSLPNPSWEIGDRIELFCKGQGLIWYRINEDVVTIWRPKNSQPADRTVIWDVEVRTQFTNELLRTKPTDSINQQGRHP